MKARVIACLLGLFVLLSSNTVFASILGEDEYGLSFCVSVDLAVGGVDFFWDKYSSDHRSNTCFDLDVYDNGGYSFVLLVKAPQGWGVTSLGDFVEVESDNGWSVYRDCVLNKEGNNHTRLRIWLVRLSDYANCDNCSWDWTPVPMFKLGAYPLAEGVCQ